ncbi:MAG: PorV/PorQ family protein [Elusimicrobiota bacterium]|nr:PorV/PorQ family protein [Elusimicrobiota bacterium]
MSSSVNSKGLTLATAITSFWLAGQPFLYGAQKTSAAYFLKLPVSADAIALGGSAVTLGRGIGSVTANPATLGFITRQEVQTTYGPHLEGYKFFNAAYGRRDAFINTGLSVTRVAADDFEGRDARGVPTGSFGAGDTAINLSAAKIFDSLSLGLNLKYISSAIENESASALAVDAGMVFLGDRYAVYPCKFGFSIRNLGTGMKYISRSEPLPLTASAAFAITIAGAVDAGISISNNLTENAFEFGLGMNFTPVNNLSLSGGVSRDLSSAASSDSAPLKLNAGIEFKMSDFTLGYGFVPMGEFGSLQRMSVSFRFGEKDGPKRKVRSNTKKYSRPPNNYGRQLPK